MENLRVRRAGFCYRRQFQVFLKRYKCLCPSTWPTWSGDPRLAVEALCKHLDYTQDQYKTGKWAMVLEYYMCVHRKHIVSTLHIHSRSIFPLISAQPSIQYLCDGHLLYYSCRSLEDGIGNDEVSFADDFEVLVNLIIKKNSRKAEAPACCSRFTSRTLTQLTHCNHKHNLHQLVVADSHLVLNSTNFIAITNMISTSLL